MAETAVSPYQTVDDAEVVETFYVYYLGSGTAEGKKISPTGRPGKEGPFDSLAAAEERREAIKKQLTEREIVDSAWTSAGEVEVGRRTISTPDAVSAIWIDRYENGRLVESGDPRKAKAVVPAKEDDEP